jgi:hypothetical protein
MAERDPRTVFVAQNAQLAEAVIKLLAANNIAAEIEQVAPPPSSAFSGLSEEGPQEFPILVTEPKQATEAKDLLTTAENMSLLRAVRDKRAGRTGTVTATCEDCGKSSEWPATAMGTTETCPHCSGYMDIPDPDDDWAGVDFGKEEGEDEAKA